tara:strand:+ start:947 stop:1630 length:684 start_codon:yes stop_codon:yes gene_type:complete
MKLREAKHPAAKTGNERDAYNVDMRLKAASERKKKEKRARFKHEITNTGNVEDLAIQYVNALKSQNEREAEEAKGSIAIRLMGIGWDRLDTTRFIDDMSAITNNTELYSLLSANGLVQSGITEASPKDRTKLYKISVGIPMIEQDNVKAEVRNLENYMKRKYIKINKAKAKINSFNTGTEEDKTVDIEVDMLVQTKFERDDIFDVLEPNFEVYSVEELDPKTKKPIE